MLTYQLAPPSQSRVSPTWGEHAGGSNPIGLLVVKKPWNVQRYNLRIRPHALNYRECVEKRQVELRIRCISPTYPFKSCEQIRRVLTFPYHAIKSRRQQQLGGILCEGTFVSLLLDVYGLAALEIFCVHPILTLSIEKHNDLNLKGARLKRYEATLQKS